MGQLNPLFIGIPLVIAVALLAFFGWQREMRKRKAEQDAADALARARELPLPDGGMGLRTVGLHAAADRSGRVMLVVDGSFGAGLAKKLLPILAASGLDHAIGSILLIELDAHRRDAFLAV